MGADVLVLVSVGRHPVSKRPRRADLDARALELALAGGGPVTALYAGPAAAAMPVLRDYLGAGATRLVALDCAAETDPLPLLEAYIKAQPARLIVAGARAEAGECSGMVPFWLADRLTYAIAANVVGIERGGETARLVQALPGGRRRALEASLPLVVTVERSGPEPRLSARMRALRGPLDIMPAGPSANDRRQGWSMKPNRPRPKRLAAPRADGPETEQRRELVGPDPDVAAEAILDFLDRDGLLAPAGVIAGRETA